MEPASIVLLVISVAVALTGGGWALRHVRDRRTVAAHSSALQQLDRLNRIYSPQIPRQGLITLDYSDRVDSKAKFDRYDLTTLFLSRLTDHEAEFQAQLDYYAAGQLAFARYQIEAARIGAEQLRRSSAPSISDRRFHLIEHKLFVKRRLTPPDTDLHVRCTVSYTSPQGRNSYTKTLGWDRRGVEQGLVHMREVRERRITTQFLRQQERNRMTASLRAQVLTRDGSRCQMCGATARDGVTLHVDHIVPVSRAGLTVLDNLQTLCADCNLGKSNRL